MDAGILVLGGDTGAGVGSILLTDESLSKTTSGGFGSGIGHGALLGMSHGSLALKEVGFAVKRREAMSQFKASWK